MSRISRLFSIGLVFLGPVARGQTDKPKGVSLSLLAQAVARVRADYFAMDYVGGATDGARLLKQFPNSRELAAWYVANLARSSQPKQAQAVADALLRANERDPWGWFAKTMQLRYDERNKTADMQRTSLEAYRRAPRNRDVIWLRASALSANDGARAIALIDSVAARGPLPQELRTLRATSAYSVATSGPKVDQAKRDSALALYAAARASDSTDATAFTFAASRMLGGGQMVEAYALAKRGVDIAPLSLDGHEWYWRAIEGLKDRSQASRDSEVFADIDRLLRDRGSEPVVLQSAANQLEAHRQPDRANALRDRILSIAPASLSAEWVIVTRYRALDRQLRDSISRDTAAYRHALWVFVDRPTHISELLLGDAYRNLFSFSDSTTDADTLLRIVRGVIKYEGLNPHYTYPGGAIRLADRGRDFAAAEQIARDGLRVGKQKIDGQKQIYETIGDYARAQDGMASLMYDALGYVYLRQKRYDDARRELDRARELEPKSINALLHLGQLSEARANLDEAEQFYRKGALLSSMGTNPNRKALERVYAARHGSLVGYETYFAGLAEADRVARKADIAATRSAAPQPLKPFSLKTLDGGVVAPDSLRGRTTVINNWGMWCGPCVAELPEFQKLSTQFAGDSTVRILTIDNDANTDSLRTWLGKRGYTFTTLLDDGYLRRIGISTYPTTWFVDSDGRIVFTKVGWSEKLVEEFGWRIDMIKRPGASP